ncbi:MAG: hypothetical protein IMW99_03775 [Firmicutes bacterium]|nr:hypothetical protein [Bacillota bacterium]
MGIRDVGMFIAGLICGGVFGVLSTALLMAAWWEDEPWDGEREDLLEDAEAYSPDKQPP